mmetsp:Transcript_82141/g.255286  ORF Transcript_82141/g.255286 Transcript_82141/m.255286 type:complete len:316 (+) Transcript_82141:77-1024(+)
MSNPDAALLLMSLHGSLLRLASSKLGKHVQGLPVAAKELAKESMISNKLRRQMTNVDTTVSYLRHVTQALCTEVVRDLEKARTAPSGCPGAGPPPAPSSRGPSRPAGPAQQAPRAAKVRVTGKPFDLPNGPEHGAEVRETGKPNVPPNVPEHVAEEQQMLQAARPLAQGCTQEQAQLYLQQFTQQQHQQQPRVAHRSPQQRYQQAMQAQQEEEAYRITLLREATEKFRQAMRKQEELKAAPAAAMAQHEGEARREAQAAVVAAQTAVTHARNLLAQRVKDAKNFSEVVRGPIMADLSERQPAFLEALQPAMWGMD